MEKTVTLGKTEGSSRRGRPIIRRIDSIIEATGVSLQLLGGAAEARTLSTSLIHGVARDNSTVCDTQSSEARSMGPIIHRADFLPKCYNYLHINKKINSKFKKTRDSRLNKTLSFIVHTTVLPTVA